MESPGVCWMMVVGLVIAGVGHTIWQAPVVGDPSVRLPMEALWNFCGTVAEPTQQPLLPPWGRLSWCAGSGGEHTDGQAGPIAKLGQAHSVRSLSLRANVCFGGGGGWCGWTAKWKLRGWCRGVAVKWEWLRVHSVQMGGWKVCLLSRCFRGVCLSRGCDMVSEGQSGDYGEDICCWACCSSEATHPKMLKVKLETWHPGVSSALYQVLSTDLCYQYLCLWSGQMTGNICLLYASLGLC